MAALKVAEQITTASIAAKSVESEKNDPAATGDSTQSLPTHPDSMVALLISRPDVKSLASLSGKTVAIGEAQSAKKDDIRTALVAAGATEVEVSTSDSEALDRVVNDQVPAAVVGLVSVDAADAFPDTKGFNVFRVPLSPR